MRKTVLAIFVKLLFCLPAQAQVAADSTHAHVKAFGNAKDTALQKPASFPLVPANYYANHLPFFCSVELKLQKALKFPVKFRLGSVEACDRIEGKGQR